MASLSTCHLGLWLGWQILLNLVKSITAHEDNQGQETMYTLHSIQRSFEASSPSQLSFIQLSQPMKTIKAKRPCTLYTAFKGPLKPVPLANSPLFTLHAGHSFTDDHLLDKGSSTVFNICINHCSSMPCNV